MENLFDYEISVNGIKNLITNYFGKILTDEQITTIAITVNDQINEDVKFIASLDPSQNNVNKVKSLKTKSLVATVCYRVANFIYYYEDVLIEVRQKLAREFMELVACKTLIDIHPGAKIGKCFFIDHGVNVVIGETCEIGDNCNIFNDVVLGSKNVKTAKAVKRHPTVKNNVTICAGSRVLGNITVGDNCFISPHAVVLDDVPDNTHVGIVNQLQLTKKVNSLPSQKLIVYGVVPKFKNTIKILGEGFYNPTVLIKLKNDKVLNYQISYWDKNKILVKFKNVVPFKESDVSGAKIIILSNADKVIVTNSYGLTKALCALTT